MTATEWIQVALALAGGVAGGFLAARVVQALAANPRRPQALRESAGALSNFTLAAGVAIGLLLALSVTSPSAVDQLPRDTVGFVPRLLGAALIVTVAYLVASLAQTALAGPISHLQPTVQRQIVLATRGIIVALAVVLAGGYLGVDTTIVELAVAAVVFGAAGTLMLLIALGGRGVAVEVAATRAVRRLLAEGDRVQVGSIRGTVATVHPTTVELTTTDGRTVLVPASHFVAEIVTIDRRASSAAPSFTPPAATTGPIPPSSPPPPPTGSGSPPPPPPGPGPFTGQ